jgi:hypothetical protein
MAIARDSNSEMPTLLRMSPHVDLVVVPHRSTGPGEADNAPMNKATAEAVVASLEEIIGTVDEHQLVVAERRG